MKILGLVFLVLSAKGSLAVIYKLNESEYNRMPTLFALDDFSSCLLQPDGTYCILDVDLYGNNSLMEMIQPDGTILDVDLYGNNSLMEMIQGYTAHTMKHFNHSQIHRGICVTETCKGFIQNRTLEREEDLKEILEECINESLWKNYELQGKVAEIDYCKKTNEETKIDLSDVLMAVVYLVIILLNVFGSLYDIFLCKENDKSGNPYLLAFSVRRNWKKLTAASGGPDPRVNRLKLFNGLRTMTMACVFFSHAVLVMAASYVENPLYIETSYEDPAKQILFNGSLVTQTFFVMSAFLLAYNFQIHMEKGSVSWLQWPKGMLLRWLRLTPTYALVLGTISTWMRHAGSGPMWDLVVVSESNACRQYWWANLLYVNNYVYDDALCTPQTWYLASDTQLFCVGLLVCVIATTPRAQKIAISILFVVSIIVPALHTYFQDLEAVVIQAPE
ncbi:hypothetical protein NE865_10749 [Phthorimaea operculella]|nr:hypothetical protein NE865_10749 [Phthorimaea operculella]